MITLHFVAQANIYVECVCILCTRQYATSLPPPPPSHVYIRGKAILGGKLHQIFHTHLIIHDRTHAQYANMNIILCFAHIQARHVP